MRISSFWRGFNKKTEPGRVDGRKDLLISGIPRSGTSFLCSLMDTYSNVVVVNEPREVKGQSSEGFGDRVARYHWQTRMAIASGKKIENKITQGGLIEDTWQNNKRARYRPKTDNAEFLLCSKNTIAYLAHLREIRAVLPSARIVLCVREPHSCLASWKTTFAHLRDPSSVRYGDVPAWQKRIRFWLDLAEQVHQSEWHDALIRYEDLVAEPQRIVQALLEQLPVGTSRIEAEPRAARSKSEALDEAERREIEELCMPVYRRFETAIFGSPAMSV